MFNNLKNNVKNKAWWVAVVSLILLIVQSKGLDLTKYIGSDWQVTLNNIFTLLALIGISVDTTASAVTDSNIVQQTQDNTNTETEVQAEETTTAINDTISENSSPLNDIKLVQIQAILNQK